MDPLQRTVVIKIFPGMSSQFKSSEQETINKTKLFGGGQSWLPFKGGCSHPGHKNVWVPAGWCVCVCMCVGGEDWKWAWGVMYLSRWPLRLQGGLGREH